MLSAQQPRVAVRVVLVFVCAQDGVDCDTMLACLLQAVLEPDTQALMRPDGYLPPPTAPVPPPPPGCIASLSCRAVSGREAPGARSPAAAAGEKGHERASEPRGDTAKGQGSGVSLGHE